MPTPKERLTHLLELAASGAAERSTLAGEVAELLLDWPAQYPAAMRATFEALLEKIVREMAAPARAALAVRFEGRSDFTPALLNEFFLDASPELKETVLQCNDAAGAMPESAIDCDALLVASRTSRAFAQVMARIAGVPDAVADAAMTDACTLCTLAKGAGVNRATFSAIAILAGPARSVQENFDMLALFDQVPQNGARRLVQFWRARLGEPLVVEQAA
jgi:hypothetical protein